MPACVTQFEVLALSSAAAHGVRICVDQHCSIHQKSYALIPSRSGTCIAILPEMM
jgi:hypothetical protein